MRRLLWVLFPLACGPAVPYETLEEDAVAHCRRLVECELVPDPEGYAEKCENDVLDDSEVALEEGRKCANAFADFLHCLGALSCDEYTKWGVHHKNDDQSVEYPCKIEQGRLNADCDIVDW